MVQSTPHSMLALENIMNATYLRKKFDAGLTWQQYLATDTERAPNWLKVYEQVDLTTEQRILVGGFSRELRMLCVSGIWCGDCVQQGPLLQRISEAGPSIDLRWVDRDEHADLAERPGVRPRPLQVVRQQDRVPPPVLADGKARYPVLGGGALVPDRGGPLNVLR